MRIHILGRISLFCFLAFYSSNSILYSQNFYVEYSQNARIIYKDIIDLKLDSVPFKISKFKKAEPLNLASLHLENYLDFFTIFINEDELSFKKRSKNKDERLKIIEKNIEDSDPYKRFVQAEIHLQWALTRSKFNQLFKAGREVYKAYNLLSENQKLFPEFIYNKKSLSILHSLIETITIANVFKSILGLDGSIDLAKVEIDEVIEYGKYNDFIFKEEADAIKALILFYQANEKNEAWSFIQESSLNVDESLLSVFLIAKLAQRIGENEAAIHILKEKPTSLGYSEFAYLDYQMGLSLLRKLDPESKKYLLHFVDRFEGKHFIKEAYQKLAWASLVFDNDSMSYQQYMSKVQSEGDDLVDDDKQALLESEGSIIPNVILLKARLLFDGAYFESAFEMLDENKYAVSSHKRLFAEYNYRQGRILQKLNRIDEARKHFDFLIKYHSDDKEFYACNSALQMGLIEENLGHNNEAKLYFEKCLSIKPKSYKRSLHQKAKTGLERILK
jgi:hypothetical protein